MSKCKICNKNLTSGNYCDEHKPQSRSATKTQAGVDGSYKGKAFGHHTSLSSQKTSGGGKGGGHR